MHRITSPRSAADFFRSRMNKDVEEVWAAALNSDKRVLAAQCLFRGTADQCLVHLRDIFRFACLHNATGLIIAHNHPSGVAKPSAEDELWTDHLLTAANIISIPVLDHLIIARRGYFSFLESGRIVVEGDHSLRSNVHEMPKKGH